jgi:rhomboid family GlyGly-CTERM serine protease
MALAGVLAAGALLATAAPPDLIDWQPSLAPAQPWRAWSAVFVHYSALHLAANLAAAALVGALGRVARVPRRCTWAWLAAWPLAHVGLLLQPALLHYGGLSGVLHAGVAVVALHLLVTGAARRIGVAMLLVLVAKVLSEAPWSGPVSHPAGWDIAIAPLAHASGLVAGIACALIAEGLARRSRHRPS